MIKRFLTLLLALCLCIASAAIFASSLLSCSASSALYFEGEGELKILCSVFAPFDIAREVGGENVTVTLLQDSGADLHNYTPAAATLDALSDADIFIYVGGVSDELWVDKAIRASGNTDMISVCLMDHIEEMHAELQNDWIDHSHGENDGEDDGEDDGGDDHGHAGHDHGGDEHIWTSLKNTKSMTEAIASALILADGANAEKYTQNRDEYTRRLDALDKEYQNALSGEKKTAVIADRFPFIYLFHDYRIPYIAAFSGCSTEINSSFETQIKLIKTVKEQDLDAILVIEGNDKSMAEAIRAETGCKILTLDSLQSISRRDIEAGASYLGIMQKNLEILREAVG